MLRYYLGKPVVVGGKPVVAGGKPVVAGGKIYNRDYPI